MPPALAHDFYGELLGWCGEDDGVCVFAREELSRSPGGWLEPVLWEVLSRCSDQDTVQFFATTDVPAASYVAWHDTHPQGDSPRLRRLVSEVVRTGPLDKVTLAARQLAQLGTSDAWSFLVRLQRETRDPRRRALAGAALRNIPGGQAEFERSCAAVEQLDEEETLAARISCTWRDPPPEEPRPAVETLRTYKEHWFDEQRVFSDQERQQMSIALAACIADDAKERGNCLSALGAVEPARALPLAQKYADDQDLQLREIARAVIAYPDNQALAAALTQLGMKASGKPAAPGAARLRAIYLLEAVFDLLRTRDNLRGQKRAEVLYDLRAHMPGLRDLVFEVPPQADLDPLNPERYRLWAYNGTTRYEVDGGVPAKERPLFTVVGFLNSIARSLRVPDRVAIAAVPRWENPWPFSFVFGNEHALCQLDRTQLLRLKRSDPGPN
jgi:hypothetical protein